MYCISVSHKNAPADIREKFAFSKEEQTEFYRVLAGCKHISGCVVISTCNRNEIYFTGDKQALDEMQDTIAMYKKLEASSLMKYYLVYEGRRAITHLHQVACGYDSMVVGEDEILRQVKEAYEGAHENKMTEYALNSIFQSAMSCSKKIKTDTDASRIPVSIGSLAAMLVLSQKPQKVLIIGITGQMGTIVMKNLYPHKEIQLMGTVRTHNAMLSENYDRLQLIAYDERYQAINEADVIVSATTSPHYTITAEELEKKTKQKNRIFIDLAVPMDIDRRIAQMKNSELYNIDYFEQLSQENNQRKLQEMERGQVILEEAIDEVRKKLYFHNHQEKLIQICKQHQGRNMEQVLYEMRDVADYDQFEAICSVIEKM